MDTERYSVGDLVVVDPTYARPTQLGLVYRITSILKVNVEAVPVAGGRRLRANPDYLLPAPATPNGQPIPTAVAVPYVAPVWLDQGQVVTIAGPGWREPAGVLYVVIRARPDTVAVAKIGGGGGKYWPKVPAAMCTIIDPARITLTPPTADHHLSR
jgi:hypothetical protein